MAWKVADVYSPVDYMISMPSSPPRRKVPRQKGFHLGCRGEFPVVMDLIQKNPLAKECKEQVGILS
jgi:hypothetical protein